VRQYAVHHALVDVRLAEPLGREPSMLRPLVTGVVLVEIVEEAGETPQLLILGEPTSERTHHALDRDEMAVGRLLKAPFVRERVRRLAIHQLAHGWMIGVRRRRSAGLTDRGRLLPVDDDELLTRAEQALTEIKVNQGLSEEHAAVLAALRIRLTGSAGASLEEMLAASEDRPEELGEKIAEAERTPKPSLDDLLGQAESRPEWPS
jgi:hypothetical protein